MKNQLIIFPSKANYVEYASSFVENETNKYLVEFPVRMKTTPVEIGD